MNGRVLWAFRFSGNCQRARTMLSLLGLDFEERPVDIRRGEQKMPGFLALNPLGLVPVLEDDGHLLRDSHAILVYLARRYGGERWWPSDPAALAEVMQWLFFSANEIQNGPNMLRRHYRLGLQIDVPAVQRRTIEVLDTLQARLASREWLEHGQPTLADVACAPYIESLGDARISLDAHPAVACWLGRCAALPGWASMPQ